MTDHFDRHKQYDELTRLIRGAGDYVQPSSDLRPRVLEDARTQRGERYARRYIRQLAVAVFLLAVFTSSNRSQVELASADGRPFLGGHGEMVLQRVEEASRNGNVGWGTVEAFTESRRRQADFLRLAL